MTCNNGNNADCFCNIHFLVKCYRQNILFKNNFTIYKIINILILQYQIPFLITYMNSIIFKKEFLCERKYYKEASRRQNKKI